MKRIHLIFIGILFCLHFNTKAQNSTDPITIKQGLGTTYYQNGMLLKPRQMLDIVKDNEEAFALMNKAKGNYDAGTIFGVVGGFLVGWPLGTAIGGGDPNWTLVGIGAGLIVVSIPFSISGKKHALNSIEIYNQSLKEAFQPSNELKLALNQHGIGLHYSF